MSRKVGILTHPLINNYGGILQAFALQEALKKTGCEVYIIDRRQNDYKIKKFVRKALTSLRIKPSVTQYDECSYPQYRFIRQFIKRTRKVDNTVLLKRLIRQNRIDCIVFGSDQIWRTGFNRNFNYDYWGCFLEGLNNVKGFSYAASIADDDWLYNEQETERIKKGINNLTAISVREIRASELCNENLGVNPKVLIDPTLLHNSSFYDQIESGKNRNPYIFVYWLGNSTEIQPVLEEYRNRYEIIVVSLRDKKSLVSVEDWLNLIKNAEIVFTDSFHGMVFSMIYHKHFIISKNSSGGINRLHTLFNLLGCPEKLYNPGFHIDYNIVDGRLRLLQSEATEFINTAIL